MKVQKFVPAIIVTALLFAAAVFYLTRSREATSPPTEAERFRIQLAADLDTLMNPKAAHRDQISALLRLANEKNSLSKEKAKEWSNSSTLGLRAGAAEALGLIDDEESRTQVKTLIKVEKNPTVLSRLAIGLAHKYSPERLKFLEDLAAQNKSASELRVNILSSLIKISQDDKVKNEAFSELLKIAKSKGDPTLSSRAYTSAMSLGPRKAEVAALIRERVLSSSNEQEKALGFRHLALIKDPKAQEVFEKFVSSESSFLRRTAIEMIPTLCPKDRWQILNERIKSDRDRSVVGVVIDIPLALNEETSVKTYNEWLKLEDLAETEKQKIRSNLQNLEAHSSGSTPCATKDATL